MGDRHVRRVQAREEAIRIGGREGLHLVPAFHEDMVLGVATYWAELFRAVPDIDVVYAPIGQGSGICAANQDPACQEEAARLTRSGYR